MSRRRRDSSDEEDGNFKYCDFKNIRNVMKKVTTKQKLTRKLTKIMTQLLLNVEISSSISYNFYVSLFSYLGIFVDEWYSYLACNMEKVLTVKEIKQNIDLILPN